MDGEKYFESREAAMEFYKHYDDAYRALWSPTNYGQSGDLEAYNEAKGQFAEAERMVLEQFGKRNPRHPECDYCLKVSVFGGPDHDASPRCRSGRRPHCSCDTCF